MGHTHVPALRSAFRRLDRARAGRRNRVAPTNRITIACTHGRSSRKILMLADVGGSRTVSGPSWSSRSDPHRAHAAAADLDVLDDPRHHVRIIERS